MACAKLWTTSTLVESEIPTKKDVRCSPHQNYRASPRASSSRILSPGQSRQVAAESTATVRAFVTSLRGMGPFKSTEA